MCTAHVRDVPLIGLALARTTPRPHNTATVMKECLHPVMWAGQAATYAGRLPGLIIATHTEYSDLENHMLNIHQLMEKVMKTRFPRPASQYSIAGKTSFAGTGLLTKEEGPNFNDKLWCTADPMRTC